MLGSLHQRFIIIHIFFEAQLFKFTSHAQMNKSLIRTDQSRLTNTILTILIYIISISIYIHPLTLSPTPSESPDHKPWNLISHPKPQLDEIHILDPDNHDVSGVKDGEVHSWKEAWDNDYWGRPLDGPSSHKSWRPVSVWSFRFFKGGNVNDLVGRFGRRMIALFGMKVGWLVEGLLSLFGCELSDASASAIFTGDILASELFVHRFVNVMIHAAIVQLVGVVAVLLFPSSRHTSYNSLLQSTTRHLSQLLFALHPTHVEAVANCANRPHLLGLLFNAAIVDPSFPLAGVAILAMAGLLSAETALFQLPAVVLTMTAIRYRELLLAERKRDEVNQSASDKSDDEDTTAASTSILLETFTSLLPRYALLLLITTIYLIYRHLNDTLSIPKGLIRPAENPFYEKWDTWTLSRRAINYSYVLSLHVMKSLGIEIVGHSHEYGFDCVPEMKLGTGDDGVLVLDLRLGLPLILIVGVIGLSAWCWHRSIYPAKHMRVKENPTQDRSLRILLLLVFFAWMATLFPIAGILKVGTFVADRIVVASTFGTCIFGGRMLALWLVGGESKTSRGGKSQQKQRAVPTRAIRPIILIALFTRYLAVCTHNRTSEWMDAVTLLGSSLRACPRSIKSNLEMSKLYSGLVPHMVDFEKALDLITTAQKIDSSFCDVHQQFGHVYFQQGKYISFERAMVKSLMCPFTMGQVRRRNGV